MSNLPLPPVARPALPAARPSYLRTQSAPFVFGLAVGAIWFWQRYLIAVMLDAATQRLMATSLRQVLAIGLGVVAAFFVLPAAAAASSTIGDARFWGMRGLARARAGLRLALALVLAFALGSLWLLQAFAPYPESPGTALYALEYDIATYPVPPYVPLTTGFALLIGLLAAFAFARWPLPAVRYPLLTQVARWIAVGGLAAVGAFLMDMLLDLASYATGIVALHNLPPFSVNFAILSHILAPVVPGAAGGLIGGLLRAGWARPARALPSAPVAPSPTPARTSRRIAAWGRGAGAVGTGLLLGLCWVAALYQLTLGPAARPVIVVLLVAPPLLIVALAAWRGRDFWAGSPAAWWRRPTPRLALAIAVILVGAAPALGFMLTFTLVNGPIIQVLLAAPVLSASLAIGFAWGHSSVRGARGGRGWWSAGTRAALLGALGYGLAVVGLIVFLVITWVNMPRPIGHGLGGGAIAFAFYVFSLETLGASLGASFAFAALGGTLGAALRVAPPTENASG